MNHLGQASSLTDSKQEKIVTFQILTGTNVWQLC